MFSQLIGGKNRPTRSGGGCRSVGSERKYKWIRDAVDADEEEFNFESGLSVYVVTWNVNSKSAKHIDLSLLLSACEKPPDVYAVGFQEIQTRTSVGAFSMNDEWIKTIMDGLHPNSRYSMVETVQLGTIMLLVAVRNALLASGILWSKATISKTFNKAKVAVGVSLLLRSVNICFVNAQFAPNTEQQNAERQTDYHLIHEMMQFQYNKTSRRIIEHDAIFFFGDLNYRLTSNGGRTRYSMESYWKSMLPFDELQREMKCGNVFDGYEESTIKFVPTYRFEAGTNRWDSSDKARDPAWCDRILWKGNRVKPMAYSSVMSIRLSDHKPVYGIFQIQNELMLPISKGNSQVTLHQSEVPFPMIRFYEKYMETFAISNNRAMHVTVRFSLQQESKDFRENWLTIDPAEVTIDPGKTLNICLRIRIDSTNACVLQSKVALGSRLRVTLGHIILQQADEEDQRVTIVGSYLTSVFGHTMETLLRLNRPHLNSTDPWVPQQKVHIETTNDLVPKMVTTLGQYLYDNGLTIPNLFADQNNQRNYREHEDIKHILHCLEIDPNRKLVADPRAVAEVLLMILESSPQPIFDAFDTELYCTQPVDLQDIATKMSSVNRAVFMYLLHVLLSYINCRLYNKCDIGRLATVFGAVLMKEHPAKLEKSRAGPIHDTNRTMFMGQILSASFSQCFVD